LGKKGSIYERELKGILGGEKKIIEKFRKSLSSEEYEWYRSSLKKPFMVIRAAGSFGVDLIAIRHDFSFPIEVKSSSSPTIRFTQASSRAQEQAHLFMEECRKAGILGLYAFRLKGYRGDPWRIFTLPSESLTGRVKLLYQVIPQIPITKEGNFILKWKEGMPLSKLLSYLNYQEYEEDGVE